MKLRELLGSPSVHIFMLAHTRGYTLYMRAREYTMMLSHRRRFRADGERAIIYLYIYICVYSCTRIQGVSSRHAWKCSEGGMRERRKKTIFRKDDDTRGLIAISPILCDSRKTRWRAINRKQIFRNFSRNSYRNGNYRFSIGLLSRRKTIKKKCVNEYQYRQRNLSLRGAAE